MNCKEFESLVNDLARASVMDAAAREKGLEHAQSCERCNARFLDEEALTRGLQALSASFSESNAPARTEAALLSAFREHKLAAPVSNQLSTLSWKRMGWFVSAAAAAAAAFVLMMTSVLPIIRHTNDARKVETGIVAQTPQTESAQPQQSEHEVNATPSLPVASQPTNVPTTYVSGMTPKMRRNPRIWPIGVNSPSETRAANVEPQEFTTDFIPLNYEAAMMPPERGRVVRVELPRSALAAFGLPVNIDRANERVKADVVLGEDGLARAIRFVR